MELIAKQLAEQWHEEVNHKYDDMPYAVGHLQQVVNVAKRFNYLIPEKDRPNVYAACWLHDSIEDTRRTFNNIKKETNETIADIVYALTNEKGRTRKERANDNYYKGIRNTEYATFVKICDRIANLEHAKKTKSRMFEMYFKEHPDFLEHLYDARYDDMFNYINELFSSNIS